MAKLTNITRGYEIDLDDELWKELDRAKVEFVSYLPGQLRLLVGWPVNGITQWCAYRINA